MNPPPIRIESPGAYHVQLKEKAAVPPDLEIGNLNEDSALATATLVEDKDDFLPAAVEMDPDAKPGTSGDNNTMILVRAVRRTQARFVVLAIFVLTVGLLVHFTTGPKHHIAQSERTLLIQEALERDLVVPLDQFDSHPYTRAMNWITSEDGLYVAPEYPLLTQRFVAAYIYFATSRVHGAWKDCVTRPQECNPNREDGEDWLSSVSECEWLGVFCDDDGYITVLSLRNLGLTGPIPVGLAQWSRLDGLVSSRN